MSFFRSRTQKPESEPSPSSFIPKQGERFLDSYVGSPTAQGFGDMKDQEETADFKRFQDQKAEEEPTGFKTTSDTKEEETADFKGFHDQKAEEEPTGFKATGDTKEEESVDFRSAADQKGEEETTECKCGNDSKEEEQSMDFKTVDGKEGENQGIVGAAIGAVSGAASAAMGVMGAAAGLAGAAAAGVGAGVAAAKPPVVTFGNIDSPTTPATMAQKRLPPRVENIFSYTVSNASAGMNDIEISVQNGNATNGNATLNGGATVKTKGSGALKVKGTDQTTPGNGNKLQLVAKYGGAVVGVSNSFSISAIPQNWNSTFLSLITGAKRGFVVQDGWESDSGTFADLNQTEISEQVQYHSGKGIFNGVASGNNSGYLPGNSLTTDSHGIGAAALTGEGTLLANQTCIFKDKRTGANNIPMKNTGYELSRVVKEVVTNAGVKTGNFEITTTKAGGKTTANGYTSDAGAGATVSKKQAV